MILDAWLPIGFRLPGGQNVRSVLDAGRDWQIVRLDGGGRALLARRDLVSRWYASRLLDEELLNAFSFGSEQLSALVTSSEYAMEPLERSRAPRSKAEALAFAVALKATRAIDQQCSLQDAIYVEALSRLLPTYSAESKIEDTVLLGSWLSGGIESDSSRLKRARVPVGWMSRGDLEEVLRAAGLDDDNRLPGEAAKARAADKAPLTSDDIHESEQDGRQFLLPGRPALESFFREHVIDVVENRERYRSLGAGFPGAVVLCGPPGCGKTFAVERLVEYLKWPSFHIDSSSVGSPYIHETSRKIAKVFDDAAQQAPSVIVIDEMDAFLAQRDAGDGQYRVEEVAEFLRRIPEAAKNDVLIVAMTNRVAAIDPAILRRGRFDHIIEVGPASRADIVALLESLLVDIPREGKVELGALADDLVGRPLSDVSFVVREGARLAARARQDGVAQWNLMDALSALPPVAKRPEREIGFRLESNHD